MTATLSNVSPADVDYWCPERHSFHTASPFKIAEQPCTRCGVAVIADVPTGRFKRAGYIIDEEQELW